jgi:putative tricarboxylic transport membrane protein
MTEESTKTPVCLTDGDTAAEGTVNTSLFCITMDKRIDLVIAICFILYGLFLIVVASQFPAGLVTDLITAYGMPYLTGGFLIVFGGILVTVRIATWSALPGNLVISEADKEDEEGYPASWKRAFSIIFLALVVVLLLDSLGYLIATPLFLIGTVWLMGVRTWKRLFLFPILFALATWYVFSQVLGFLIPLGILEETARSLGFLL